MSQAVSNKLGYYIADATLGP